jgi:hypothetical protein
MYERESLFVCLLVVAIFVIYTYYPERYFGQNPVDLTGWVSNNPNFGYLPNLAK